MDEVGLSAAPDVLYQLSWGDVRVGVVVRGDTVVDAPPILKWTLGKPIGRLLFWVAHEPRGAWLRMPEATGERAYQRSIESPGGALPDAPAALSPSLSRTPDARRHASQIA